MKKNELMKVANDDFCYTLDDMIDRLTHDKNHIGDYFTLVTKSGKEYHMVAAGITDDYIDFISDELVDGSVGTTMNSSNTNCSLPEKYVSLTGAVQSALNLFWEIELPDNIKPCIIDKIKLSVPTRMYEKYKDKRENDTIMDVNFGKLWIPLAEEVFGPFATIAGQEYIKHDIQYPIFKSKKDREKMCHNQKSSWWTASATPGSSSNMFAVDTDGEIEYKHSSSHYCGFPLCFRMALPSAE